MDILETGTRLIKDNLGVNLENETIQSALSSLLGGEGGAIDIQQLISGFMAGGGLENIVQSWLGDGENAAISPEKIADFFGNTKILEFAKSLGIGESEATKGLAEVIPQLIDKVSSGGSLLDEAANLGGMFDMAKKLF